uniref:Uncharacterized protein n=1 Tax=Salmonella phage PMBT37 TaxID=3153515 RepID=A0AAU8GKG8_9CAUD
MNHWLLLLAKKSLQSFDSESSKVVKILDNFTLWLATFTFR